MIHLPKSHTIYLKRIRGDWLARALEESGRRMLEAHSPSYELQSATKTLGPWGLGWNKRGVTWDEMFEELEEQRMDALQQDLLGYDDDDVGYYDDDWSTNAADEAACPENI